MSDRAQRLAASMQAEIASILAREVKDPRVAAAGLMTVTQVALNPDLRLARVYVSFANTDADKKTACLAALEKVAGFVRGEVGRRLNLRRAPELRFVIDDSQDKIAHIEALLREEKPE
jgi:ribosome-binding factor A